MTRSIVVGLLLLSVAGSVQGANVNTSDGTNALLFTFDDFDLSSFNGGIGFRHYLKDGLALRPGVNLGFSSSKDERYRPAREVESTSALVGASLALERHWGPTGPLSPYIGIEGEYQWTRTSQEMDDDMDVPGWTTTDEVSTGAGIFSGLLGFEWGFAERLTLGGEYRIRVRFESTSRESESADSPVIHKRDESRSSFSLYAASIYLSVGI